MRLGFSGNSSGTTNQLATREISSSSSHGQPSVEVSGRRGGLRVDGRGASGPGGRGRWPVDGGGFFAICALLSRALFIRAQCPPDLASLPGLPGERNHLNSYFSMPCELQIGRASCRERV